MKLSEADRNLIAILRKRQQQFNRWRWVGLVGALICIGNGIFLFLFLMRLAQEPALEGVRVIAILEPFAVLLQFTGFGLLIYLISFWRGRPETILLLRLLEDS